MKRALFTFLFAASLLTACGPAPETLDMDGPTGITTTGTGSTGDEGGSTTGDSGTDSGDETSGGETGTTDGGETGDTDGADTGEPDPNPTIGEPCDPLLAFDGIEPCEWLPGAEPWPDAELTCSLDPNSGDGLCMLLTDNQGDGADIHDGCDDPSEQQGMQTYGCFNGSCLDNNTNPAQPELGEWVLPQGFCDDAMPNGYSKCCTMFCEQTSDCGDPGLKCKPLINAGAPGICVNVAFSG